MKVKKFKHLKKYGNLTGQYYKGGIECSVSRLDSLEGAPKKVTMDFWCNVNNLETLKGAPEVVGKNFFCNYNNDLISLEGAPKVVNGSFSCSSSRSLETLEGAPKYVGEGFDCEYCPNLESLVGFPEHVGTFIECDKKLKKGENLYLMANALINGCFTRYIAAKEQIIYENVLLKYFSD